MSSDYWLGVATLPALGAALAILIRLNGAIVDALGRRGWKVSLKASRKPENISDFTLQHDIWFERQHGPIFTGHWCRESLRDEGWVATRWLGIGNASGRSLIVYHKRALEE